MSTPLFHLPHSWDSSGGKHIMLHEQSLCSAEQLSLAPSTAVASRTTDLDSGTQYHLVFSCTLIYSWTRGSGQIQVTCSYFPLHHFYGAHKLYPTAIIWIPALFAIIQNNILWRLCYRIPWEALCAAATTTVYLLLEKSATVVPLPHASLGFSTCWVGAQLSGQHPQHFTSETAAAPSACSEKQKNTMQLHTTHRGRGSSASLAHPSQQHHPSYLLLSSNLHRSPKQFNLLSKVS